MMRTRRSGWYGWLLPLWLGPVVGTAEEVAGQASRSDTEQATLEIELAVADQIRSVYGGVITFDPRPLLTSPDDPGEFGPPRASDRATRIASRLSGQVNRLEDVRVCDQEAELPMLGCRLVNTSHVVVFSEPEIRGVTAVVWVRTSSNAPGAVQPISSSVNEYGLTRTEEGWTVTSYRNLAVT